MAVTNRNRKLLIEAAWKHYWSVLFPGGLGWEEDLKTEIQRRLYFPGKVDGFCLRQSTDLCPPMWADSLDISIEDSTVSAKFQNAGIGSAPLFLDSQHKPLSNWKAKNPLGRSGTLPRNIHEERRDLLNAAVRDCGYIIRGRLVELLSEKHRAKFEVYCKPNGDVFAEERKLPVDGRAAIIGIDIDRNRLTAGPGSSAYHYVQIKQKTENNSKAGPRGSLCDQDLALVEEMKNLVDTQQCRSVRQAAAALEPKARRRDGARKDSVIRRLQNRFSEIHPNYLNAKSLSRS